MQIVRALLGVEILECEQCRAVEFEKNIEKPDLQWLAKNIKDFNPRASPNQPNKDTFCSNPHLEKSPIGANRKVVPQKQQTATQTIL